VATTVSVRASSRQLRQALALLPRIVSGRASGYETLVRALLVRVGLTALGRVKGAFVVKARGGTDEAGERWAPLAPATVAARRRPRGVRRSGNRPVEILRDTGLLLNSLSPALPADLAKHPPPPVANQVFRLGVAAVMIGTNRKWAWVHHEGLPGKIPQRRLWPAPARWPSAWWQDILEQAREGLIEMAVLLAKGAKT
jgi:hypothetical protein